MLQSIAWMGFGFRNRIYNPDRLNNWILIQLFNSSLILPWQNWTILLILSWSQLASLITSLMYFSLEITETFELFEWEI